MKHTVDNFDLLEQKLFEAPVEKDEFFFVQILRRQKDGNIVSGPNKNRLVKYYTIRSAEELEHKRREISAVCEACNARAYIHPAKRNMVEVASLALKLSAHAYAEHGWMALRGVYSTAAGKSFVASDKKYIIDLDGVKPGDPAVSMVRKKLYSYRGSGGEQSDKVFMTVPTKNGVHIVAYPFDVKEFKKDFPTIDVHTNNPTLLYCAWEDCQGACGEHNANDASGGCKNKHQSQN